MKRIEKFNFRRWRIFSNLVSNLGGTSSSRKFFFFFFEIKLKFFIDPEKGYAGNKKLITYCYFSPGSLNATKRILLIGQVLPLTTPRIYVDSSLLANFRFKSKKIKIKNEFDVPGTVWLSRVEGRQPGAPIQNLHLFNLTKM